MPQLQELAHGRDKVGITQMKTIIDALRENAQWIIEKFHGDYKSHKEALEAEGKPFEVLKFKGNCLLNEGIGELEDIIAGLGTPTKWDNSNAYLGVGDSSTAAVATQTELLGSNKTYDGMDSGYPQRSTQELSWKSTFGDAEGNHGWKEFTVSNTNSDTGKNLNRKVDDKGVKSGGTWVLTLKITIS